MSEVRPTLAGGSWTTEGEHGAILVTNPFDGSGLEHVPLAGPSDVDRALESAHTAFRRGSLSPTARSTILRRTAHALRSRADELATQLARESGNPVTGARGEVARSAAVLEEAAEEARRITGHLVPVDAAPGSEERIAFTRRFPIGVVGAITPFNGPLLSPAHKVGAAIAAGDPVVLKPPPVTPLGALELARELVEAGLPEDQLHVLIGDGDVGEALVADKRTAMITFTGSTAVGNRIHSQLGVRPALLELGGNAPMIVHHDADVAAAATAAAPGAFGFAGQVCISVQRLLVHRNVYDEFTETFLAHVENLRLGDPLDESTDIGPMITPEAAEGAMHLISSARDAGGELLTGGRRDGSLVWPAVVTGADSSSAAVCQEAFAPIVYLDPYDELDEAFAISNATDFGLQASIYTNSFDAAMRAMSELRFGGVIVNDSPRYRVDLMPYGGVKASGTGREAPRYSIERMTEERLIVMKERP